MSVFRAEGLPMFSSVLSPRDGSLTSKEVTQLQNK